MKKKFMLAFLKNLFIIIVSFSFAISIDFFLVPTLWEKVINANNSFSSKIYGMFLFMSLVPNFLAIFYTIVIEEKRYKKSRRYNPVTRKWEKK